MGVLFLDQNFKNLIIEEANYILATDSTIRNAANYFGVSKSVFHRHLNNDLKQINYSLYLKIKNVFLEHTKVRHIHGGNATKQKYLKESGDS